MTTTHAPFWSDDYTPQPLPSNLEQDLEKEDID